MKRKLLIVLASAFTLGSSFAAPIPIMTLPCNIRAPGNYVVASNISSTAPFPYAITINSPLAGKIVLDLGGFTIQGFGGPFVSGISIENPTGSNIVIRNGQLSNFWVGIEANPLVQATGWISNVHIENVVFFGEIRTSVSFYQVNSGSVIDCNFIGAIPGHSASLYGIQDVGTQTGNRYVDDVFDGGQAESLAVSFSNSVVVDCHAAQQSP